MVAATTITPIDQAMQERVTNEVERYLLCAQSLYHRQFDPIEVMFNLKGKAAGMYKVSYKGRYRQKTLHRQIRFNPWLFAKYPEDSWNNTIAHEVAHYIADCLYDSRAIRPHGKQWQTIMCDLGADPIVRAHYDLSGIPTRKTQSFPYTCECREVSLSLYRHRKICSGQQRYRCRDCGAELVLADAKA